MLSTEVSSPAPVWPRVSTAPLGTLAAQPTPLPVAVLGAGPVGLAAVAKLIERDMPFVVLEAGERVGANLLDYGHVRLFSPWQYNVDPTMAKLLAADRLAAPRAERTAAGGRDRRARAAAVRAAAAVAAALQLRTRVVSVTREGFDKVKSTGRETAPFVIRAHPRRQADRAARPRGHRRHRHLEHAEPARRQRPAGHRRARSGAAHLLRHPGRARRASRALRGQEDAGRRGRPQRRECAAGAGRAGQAGRRHADWCGACARRS